MKNKIIVLYNQSKSIREIARTTSTSRNTVRKYIREYEILKEKLEDEIDLEKIKIIQAEMVNPPTRKGVRVRRVFVGELEKRFYELMELDEQRNKDLKTNKQQATAARIHRQLLSEGFKIGISTIQEKFREYKNKNKETYIKQEYEPGFRAEYDFHEIKVYIDNKLRRIYQATITLPHSGYTFTKYYINSKMEVFIDSIVSFFEEIGGVVLTMVFDNMRNVVRNFVYRGEKEYTESLIKLSNYYGFEIKTTNPYSGNEKGHVEQAGKNVRLELFTFKYKFKTLDELNEYAKEELKKFNEDKNNSFKNEQAHLYELPKVRYELGALLVNKVDKQSFITIDNNYYSVPDQYVLKKVSSTVYTNQIMVYNEYGDLIASHNKKVGKGEYTIDILHFTSTFMKKPGALLNSLALKQAPKVYQTLFHKYFTTKVKEFIKLIKEKTMYELSEYLVKLNNGEKIELIKDKITIEDVSINQLNQISDMFNQANY